MHWSGGVKRYNHVKKKKKKKKDLKDMLWDYRIDVLEITFEHSSFSHRSISLTKFFAGDLLSLLLMLFGFRDCILFIESVVAIGCSLNGSGYWCLSINLWMVAWHMLLGKDNQSNLFDFE